LYTQAVLSFREGQFQVSKRLLAESLANHLLALIELPEDPSVSSHFGNDCTVLQLVFQKLEQPERAGAIQALAVARPVNGEIIIQVAQLLGEAMGDVSSAEELTAADSRLVSDHLAEATVELAKVAVDHQIFSSSQLSEQLNDGGAFAHLKDRGEFSAIEVLLDTAPSPKN
jgi:hypothetical protein